MNDPIPCDGIPLTTADLDGDPVQVRFMLQHAVRCPLCRAWVVRWRIENGRMSHDPGE